MSAMLSATGWLSTITSPIRCDISPKTKPSFMMEQAAQQLSAVHLFDEPQFNTQDGYIGFMLDFFRKLTRGRPAGIRLPAPDGGISDSLF